MFDKIKKKSQAFLKRKEINITQKTNDNDKIIKKPIFDEINLKHGFICYEVDEILQEPHIKELIEKISIAFGSKREIFDSYLMPSIRQAALYMQKLPGAESTLNGDYISPFGHHGGIGGLLLHSLEVMCFALNDSRLAFFNRGVMPKKRALNMQASRIACGLAALLHDIGKLEDLIIVTVVKDVETDLDTEIQYHAIEPLVEFLSHTHNISVKDIYALGDKAPRYFIKGWKKGRSSHHDAISPFLMRSFVSKSALKLISTQGDNLLSDFMLATDWSVLQSDLTSKKNIIHDIWLNADKTSSANDRRKSSLNALSPIKADIEIKNALISAMQDMCNNSEIAINKADPSCFVFTHKSPHAQDFIFFVIIRFDTLSETFIKRIILKANDLYKYGDVLNDNEPSLDNIYKLFQECSLITNTEGLYDVHPTMLAGSRNEEYFNAIALNSWHDLIPPYGKTYEINRDVYEKLTCNFKGKEPAIIKKIDKQDNLDIDTTSDVVYKGKIYTIQELKEAGLYEKVFPKSKQEKENKTDDDTNLSQDKSTQDDVNTNLNTNESTQDDISSNLNPDDECEIESEDDDLKYADDDEEVKDDINDNESKSLDINIAPPSFIEDLMPKAENKDNNKNDDENQDISDSDLNKIFSNPFGGKTYQDNTDSESLEDKETENTKKLKKQDKLYDEDDETLIKPFYAKNKVDKDVKYRNYNKAQAQFKKGQDDINEIRKSSAVKIENINNNKKEDEIELAIKGLCSKIDDEHFARNVEIMIKARLKGNFSLIDYITTDEKFCYAAIIWDNSIKKDANNVQVFNSLKEHGLFANLMFGSEHIKEEIFYFEHVQLVKEITNIFAMSKLKPNRIKCRESPFTKTPGKPPDAKKLVEYVKYRLLSLDESEDFYGYKAHGVATDNKGKRISVEALNKCYQDFGGNGKSRLLRHLTLSSQVTPPYLIRDKDDLILCYLKPKNNRD